MSKDLTLQDKLILGIAMGVLGWAGLQLIETEKMEERIKFIEEKIESTGTINDENRQSIQALIGLHLQPTKDNQK